VGEVEVDGKGIAFGRIHVYGGGAGGKVFGREVELKSGAGERAAAVLGADEIGLAGRRESPKLFVVAGDLHVEVFPEVIGTRDQADGRTGAGARGARDIRAIRISELDLHDDSYEFGLIAMIERGLLSAVVGLPAGMLDEKGERSQESDRGDARTGLWRLQELCVFVEESGHSFVMALAEKVGFPDGLVGQRSVESEGGRGQQGEGCKD
jgi:hypothetical protein